MNILYKRNLFVLGAFLFTGYLSSTESSAGPTKGSTNTEEEMVVSKQNAPKKDDFLSRVKNLPKESLEKKDNSKLSPEARHRDDKFWTNKEGKRVLLESM